MTLTIFRATVSVFGVKSVLLLSETFEQSFRGNTLVVNSPTVLDLNQHLSIQSKYSPLWSKEPRAVKQSIQAELQSEMFDAINDIFDSVMCQETHKNLQQPKSKLCQDSPL
jgi:hypothetical protein